MKLTIPELSLVLLVGASGAGKSTFARAHFKATEVLSSDACRGLVSDDESSLAATKDAFEVLHFIAAKRLALGKLTVVDATNVQPEARKPLVALARQYHCLPVAIVLNLPDKLCLERNRGRPDRDFGPHVVRRQSEQLRRSLRGLRAEGFRHVHVLTSPEEIQAATIEREPLHNNLKHEHGPFDIIGDVHGCFDELLALLEKLGYEVVAPSADAESAYTVRHPEGRKALFLGDLVDRGPKTPEVLRLVMDMVGSGSTLCVPGNHDMKLMRKLKGRDVQITHGLAESLEQLRREPPGFVERVVRFLDGLVSHYVLDDGRLVVAHAGMIEEMQGRGSAKVRDFALYGETTGETDELGLPVRGDWAASYRGKATVVYGHTPVEEPEWLNGTIDVDTGCVFGGKLTALRYPERELVSVPAAQTYYAPARPFRETAPSGDLTAQQRHDDLLDIDDVLGKRVLQTRLQHSVTIREENAITALEAMSRFAADPKWLIYLPPTMSPSETSGAEGLLEHPSEAFAYYRVQGVPRVVCQEKHMGSRAIVVVCRDEEAARRRFGVAGESGICYTRTGRRFFEDRALEAELLTRMRAALDAADFWARFETDWVCLDGELMPWSAKARELLRQQYAPVGAAARGALAEAVRVLERAAERGADLPAGSDVSLLPRYRARAELAGRYVDAYRRYCWPTTSLADLRLAPFHLLATEGAVHTDKDHVWQMETLAELFRADVEVVAARRLRGDPTPGPDPRGGEEHRGPSLQARGDPSLPEGGEPTPGVSPPRGGEEVRGWGHFQDEDTASLLVATPYRLVDVTDPASQAAGIAWWEELTGRGGEGMVVKPLDFIARGPRGLVQPAVKCRGREYLRIIYGPEYTAPEHLLRLRSRGLSTKRSLALRELALGIEALERFVRREPLRRVHECVFGVLALESEPVDPRL